MPQKRIDKDKIINAFLSLAFDKSAGAVSLADIANMLGIKKASLYNHFASRDEMYAETVVFCAEYLESVSFYVDDFATAPQLAEKFSALIMQYFRSHTMEPLLQVYSFIHSEKYFNETASRAAENAKKKITEDVEKILSLANAAHLANFSQPADASPSESSSQSANTAPLADANLANTSHFANAAQLIATLILQSLDSYVLQRKDAIRKNPEQVAGSLFELPFEETIQQKLIAQVAEILLLCT